MDITTLADRLREAEQSLDSTDLDRLVDGGLRRGRRKVAMRSLGGAGVATASVVAAVSLSVGLTPAGQQLVPAGPPTGSRSVTAGHPGPSGPPTAPTVDPVIGATLALVTDHLPAGYRIGDPTNRGLALTRSGNGPITLRFPLTDDQGYGRAELTVTRPAKIDPDDLRCPSELPAGQDCATSELADATLVWRSRTETSGPDRDRATETRATAYRHDGAVITLVQDNRGAGPSGPLTRSTVPLDRTQAWAMLALPGWDEVAAQVR